jgi:RNA polymerase sigma factor (sigma-70 family)
MKMTENQRLLAEFVSVGSEQAFRELLTRYINLVYSAAVRLVNGDTHLAQDVTQTVFVDLARMARTLPKTLMIGGWLHHHTVLVAGTTMRSERRRHLRERQAVEMNAVQDHSDTNLDRIAPILDEAIDRLRAEDRKAILLRFFEQLDFRSVGETLGSSEEAARKRVARALEKLHFFLERRGVALSAAALGTALATEAVTAAPAGLAGTIAGTALVPVAVGGGITAALSKLMIMTKLKLGVISAMAVAAMAVPLLVQNQSMAKLEGENHALRQQVEQIAQVQAENERLSNVVAQANASQSLPPEQVRELLKLRGEIGALRQQGKELVRLQQENRQLRSQPTVAPKQAQPILLTDEQTLTCIHNLREIDGASQQCALENKMSARDIVTSEQILPYLKRGKEVFRCPSGGSYTFGSLTNMPTCSIPGHAIAAN